MSLRPATSALIVFLCLESAAYAAKVYLLRSGDAQSDQAVQTTLEQRGHTVTMGPVSVDFTGNQANLGSFDVTLLLYPSDGGRMQVAGTAALRSHLINGGRLITGEWFNGSFGDSSDLRPLLPVTRTGSYYLAGQTTFAKAEPDALIDDGVSDTLMFNISGENALVPSADTKIYFTSRRSNGPGLVGKTLAGGGRILSFATSITSSELQNADFRRLLGNAVNWATVPYSPNAPNPAEAARVYLLRSGDADTDREVQRVLTERGHSVTTGPVSIDFTGSQANLGSFDVTLLLYPSDGGRMQAAGTAALRTHLSNGGRLVTGEWFNGSFGDSSNLRPLLPVTRTGSYYTGGQTTYVKGEPDALLDDGVSDTFTFNISGENAFIVTADAKIYFASRRTSAPGLVGNVLAGGGKVLCFSTSIGALEVQNADFRRLLGNAINWAKPFSAPPPPPPPSVSITPTSLSFSFTTSGSPPASQTLTLTSPGASVDFTATASTTLGANWLTVSPASGTTPNTLSVTVTPTGLTPGTYTGEVAVISGATSHIPVTLTVVPGSACTYTLSPLTVNFTAAGGAGDIGVSTQTGCAWTATANATWITVASGGSGSGPGTVHYNVAANTGAASRPGTLTAGGQQFSINQAGSALSFIVGPSPLTFRFTQGDTAPAERTLYINPSASGATFSMTASGGTWLSANPNSGIVPGAVIVTVNPSGLAAGTYKGSITVRIPNASPTDQIVPVEITIESAGAPQLGIDSSTINFTATKGGHADTRKLQVLNRGSGTVVFRTAASGGSWLSVQPDNGTATVASPATLVVTANPQGLEAGTYTGRVLVTPASGDPVGVDVFFTVSAANRTMLLSQSGLTFTAVAQGGAVPSQNFGILNTAEGVMDWSVAASTLAGGPWLSVTPNRGSTDAASLDVPLADVNINPAGLAPGEYHGLLTVSSSTAANSPQLVSILLRVLPPGSDPGPVVRPTGLIFTAAAGSAAAGTQEVLVSNLAASPRNFTSSRLTYDGASWFTHLPVASTVAPSQPTRILVQANSASLQPGVRRGVLTLLFADGAVQNVSILSLVATPPVPALAKNSVSAASSCGTPALQVQPTSLRNDFTAVVGQATTIAVKAADECGRLLDKTGLVTVRFSTGEPSITLANLGGGNWTATWRPVRAIGSVAMEISAFSFDVPISRGGRALLTGSVADTSQLPLVTAGGIVQAASFARGLPLAPGSLVTVYGSNLADGESRADGLPLPNELNHVQVVLGDRSLPLLYTSSGQVNVQVPYSLPVNTQHQIAVRRGTVLSVPETLSVAAAQPGIFTQNQNGLGQGVILRADGVTLAGPDSPAAVGETVVVYCTGLGNVDPPVSEGTAAPSSSRARTTNPVTLRIGGVEAQVVFSGLAPENVGLYRVEAVVPQVTPGDAVSVQIEVAGQISPPVTMAIR